MSMGDLQRFLLLFLIVAGRYFVVAGLPYWWCWVKKRKSWHAKKITPSAGREGQIPSEIFWSLVTTSIFAGIGTLGFWMWERGWTKIYLNVADYGWLYTLLSFPLLLVLHDTYFYWAHRAMHWRRLMWMHRVHHHSMPPSPWAAFSFHPGEGLVEAVALPVMIVVFPIHAAVLLLFLVTMTLSSVQNHLGYELFPKWFLKVPVLRQWITATHHEIHHSRWRYNYALYFRWWDRWMRTELPEYETTYQEIMNRAPNKSARSSLASVA